MTVLSVNINKIATLRNSRGGLMPNVVETAIDIERFGAQGITVHPRPDERHIKSEDVYNLAPVLTTEFNIEGYPNQRFIDMVKQVKPAQATLVPDSPDVLTSNAGWDTHKHKSLLLEVIKELKAEGVRTSIFVDTDLNNIEGAATTGTDRIELYTEAYAQSFPSNPEGAIAPYIKASELAIKLGLGVNAGHDLNMENLRYFNKNIDGLLEVSIGHALICDSLYYGLENMVKMYLDCLRE